MVGKVFFRKEDQRVADVMGIGASELCFDGTSVPWFGLQVRSPLGLVLDLGERSIKTLHLFFKDGFKLFNILKSFAHISRVNGANELRDALADDGKVTFRHLGSLGERNRQSCSDLDVDPARPEAVLANGQ